jgi:hypothetical protein
VVDVDANTGKIVIAGSCEDDQMCGADKPNPIIELIEPTYLHHEWTTLIPTASGIKLKTSEAISFRPDGL